MGHMLWYWQTPLGQNPTLDGHENLILAEQIASGTLAKERIYFPARRKGPYQGRRVDAQRRGQMLFLSPIS